METETKTQQPSSIFPILPALFVPSCVKEFFFFLLPASIPPSPILLFLQWGGKCVRSSFVFEDFCGIFYSFFACRFFASSHNAQCLVGGFGKSITHPAWQESCVLCVATEEGLCVRFFSSFFSFLFIWEGSRNPEYFFVVLAFFCLILLHKTLLFVVIFCGGAVSLCTVAEKHHIMSVYFKEKWI